MSEINIVWVGCHEEGLRAFQETIASGKKIAAFVTLDEQAFAKRSAGSRGYSDYCRENDIPYYTVATIKSDEAYDIIKHHSPDLLVVLGWSEILPEPLLSIPSI